MCTTTIRTRLLLTCLCWMFTLSNVLAVTQLLFTLRRGDTSDLVPVVVDGAAEEALVVHFGTNTAGEAALRLQALRGALGKNTRAEKRRAGPQGRRPHVLSAHDRHGGFQARP